MESIDFKEVRSTLSKTQKGMAQLLGVSVKAIHSYEQGWRKIPHHVERQLLFLLSRFLLKNEEHIDKCWDILNCPESKQTTCPAREFDSGDLCWFINGTTCNGQAHNSWADKMEECKTCKVFKNFFETRKGQ